MVGAIETEVQEEGGSATGEVHPAGAVVPPTPMQGQVPIVAVSTELPGAFSPAVEAVGTSRAADLPSTSYPAFGAAGTSRAAGEPRRRVEPFIGVASFREPDPAAPVGSSRLGAVLPWWFLQDNARGGAEAELSSLACVDHALHQCRAHQSLADNLLIGEMETDDLLNAGCIYAEQLRAIIAGFRAKIEAEGPSSTVLREDLRRRTAQLEASLQQVEDLGTELGKTRAILAVKESKLRVAEAVLATKGPELESVTAALARKESELQEANAALAAKESELQGATAALVAKDSELQALVAKSSQDLSEAKTLLAEKDKELAKASEDMAKLVATAVEAVENKVLEGKAAYKAAFLYALKFHAGISFDSLEELDTMNRPGDLPPIIVDWKQVSPLMRRSPP